MNTRALLNAALSGKLLNVEYYTEPALGYQVPKTCEGVPAEILNPANSWHDKKVYMQWYRGLASRFIDNFKKFEAGTQPEMIAAGPRM